MKLSEVPTQVDVRVSSIELEKGKKQRIAARGLHKGCTVSILQRIGNNLIVMIDDSTRMIIGNGTADKVSVFEI